MTLVRIVPPAPSESGIVKASGTKVYAADGTEIQGITSITLTAKVGDIWRATIECMVTVGEMTAELDVTALADTSRVYEDIAEAIRRNNEKLEASIVNGLRKNHPPGPA